MCIFKEKNKKLIENSILRWLDGTEVDPTLPFVVAAR